MMALTGVVGAVLFLPIRAEEFGVHWWAAVIGLDAALALVAIAIGTRASWTVAALSVWLVLCHLCADTLLVQIGEFDPYTTLVRFFEICQLISCAVLSKTGVRIITSAITFLNRKVPPCQRREIS